MNKIVFKRPLKKLTVIAVPIETKNVTSVTNETTSGHLKIRAQSRIGL